MEMQIVADTPAVPTPCSRTALSPRRRPAPPEYNCAPFFDDNAKALLESPRFNLHSFILVGLLVSRLQREVSRCDSPISRLYSAFTKKVCETGFSLATPDCHCMHYRAQLIDHPGISAHNVDNRSAISANDVRARCHVDNPVPIPFFSGRVQERVPVVCERRVALGRTRQAVCTRVLVTCSPVSGSMHERLSAGLCWSDHTRAAG